MDERSDVFDLFDRFGVTWCNSIHKLAAYRSIDQWIRSTPDNVQRWMA